MTELAVLRDPSSPLLSSDYCHCALRTLRASLKTIGTFAAMVIDRFDIALVLGRGGKLEYFMALPASLACLLACSILFDLFRGSAWRNNFQ